MRLQRDNHAFRRLRRRIGQQPVAAVQLLFFRITRNIQRDALPGMSMFSRLVLRVKPRTRIGLLTPVSHRYRPR
jgi:hypothetical protein